MMKAMILAAGRGERMKPFTDNCPKPLLSLGKESLLSRHIKRLKKAGITEIVINHAWLGSQIEATIGDGNQFGVTINYSAEGEIGLETAGGIATALPLLGTKPFLVINGDVFTNMDFSAAVNLQKAVDGINVLAHLWLTQNPEHNQQGDFSIDKDGYAIFKNELSYTFTGIAIYHPNFFKNIPANTRSKLGPIIKENFAQKTITASILNDTWLDVGTPKRLDMAKKLAQTDMMDK